MLVLLIEDEVPLAKLVCEYLENESLENESFKNKSFQTDHAATAKHAQQLIKTQTFDVIILDINLPDMSGFELCTQLRADGINTPIIMLTARHHIDDKAQGFLAGTDDYLVKPFEMQELVMRLQALRQRGKRSNVITLGKLQLEVGQHSAIIESEEVKQAISLTPDEWKLLLLLCRENQILSRDKLFRELWPDDSGTDDGLKMLIFRLRKTIKHTLDELNLTDDVLSIKTVRGIGIKLEHQA